MMEENELTLDDSKFVTSIGLGDEFYALDTHDIREMVKLGDVTTIASGPSFLRGVMNLRGKIVNIIDLHQLMTLGKFEPTVDSRVVIIQHEGTSVGLCVDRVDDIFEYEDRQILPVPVHLEKIGKFLKGVIPHQGNALGFIDLGILLRDNSR